jgi:hypothetical protein
MRPDGSPHSVCASHGGLTPNPRTAILSDRGRQVISATSKQMWERYRAAKAAGLPVPRVGRPKRPVARAEAPSAVWQETDAERKERIRR